jgi:hypothetical protein
MTSQYSASTHAARPSGKGILWTLVGGLSAPFGDDRVVVRHYGSIWSENSVSSGVGEDPMVGGHHSLGGWVGRGSSRHLSGSGTGTSRTGRTGINTKGGVPWA